MEKIMFINLRLKLWIPQAFVDLVVTVLLLYRRLRYGYPFRCIRLTNGMYTIVDPENFDWLNNYKWHCKPSSTNFYAVTYIIRNNIRIKEYMHRLVLSAPPHLFVDHINRKSLDNRKANLRHATAKQNMWNRDYGKNLGTSKYKGVHWAKREGKWRALITVSRKTKHLGFFFDEKSAARAYDEAAKKFHGEFAVLNYPGTT